MSDDPKRELFRQAVRQDLQEYLTTEEGKALVKTLAGEQFADEVKKAKEGKKAGWLDDFLS